MLDPAILRPARFDEIIRIPLPDDEGRQEIFKVHLKGKPVTGDIDVAELVRTSAGFSGAEVAAVCARAALAAVRRAVASCGEDKDPKDLVVQVLMSDLTTAVDGIRAR